MQVLFITIQLILCFLLVATILLQKTSSDGLSGLSGGGGGLSGAGIISNRTSTNILYKASWLFALLFMINSLVLANLATRENSESKLVDKIIEIEQKQQTESNTNKDLRPEIND